MFSMFQWKILLFDLILTQFFNIFFQNVEAEKQLKFFQGCVAAAFAERDNSIMEVMAVTLFKFFC